MTSVENWLTIALWASIVFFGSYAAGRAQRNGKKFSIPNIWVGIPFLLFCCFVGLVTLASLLSIFNVANEALGPVAIVFPLSLVSWFFLSCFLIWAGAKLSQKRQIGRV